MDNRDIMITVISPRTTSRIGTLTGERTFFPRNCEKFVGYFIPADLRVFISKILIVKINHTFLLS